MPKIITVYSLKGGSGKTTISILIAQWLSNKGKKVAIIDSDVAQKSCANWVENSNFDINCYLIQNNLSKDDLNSLDNDYVIIDGVPKADKYVEQILSLSDIVLIPVQPTQLSLSSFLQDNHLTLLKKIKAKGIELFAVMNGVSQYNRKETEALKSIILENSPIKDVFKLGLRKAFVIDYSKKFTDTKNSIAKNEIGYLVDNVLAKLK